MTKGRRTDGREHRGNVGECFGQLIVFGKLGPSRENGLGGRVGPGSLDDVTAKLIPTLDQFQQARIGRRSLSLISGYY